MLFRSSRTGFWPPPPLCAHPRLAWQGICSLPTRWPSDALLWFRCLRFSPQRPGPRLLCGQTCNSFLCCCRFRGPEVISTVSGTRSTTVTFTVRPGTSQPITLQSRPPDYESRNSGPRRAPSPVVSPTELNKEVLPTPLPAATAAPSPTLSPTSCSFFLGKPFLSISKQLGPRGLGGGCQEGVRLWLIHTDLSWELKPGFLHTGLSHHCV